MDMNMNHPIVAFLPTMAAASALASGVAAGYTNLTKEKKELVVQVAELKAEKVELEDKLKVQEMAQVLNEKDAAKALSKKVEELAAEKTRYAGARNALAVAMPQVAAKVAAEEARDAALVALDGLRVEMQVMYTENQFLKEGRAELIAKAAKYDEEKHRKRKAQKLASYHRGESKKKQKRTKGIKIAVKAVDQGSLTLEGFKDRVVEELI